MLRPIVIDIRLRTLLGIAMFCGPLSGMKLALAQTNQDIDPRGIFFNRFSGAFSGTEWFQTIPTPGDGPDAFRLADIFGGGLDARITADGQITLLDGVGSGNFSGPDRYTIRPNLGGARFTFTCNRIDGTDADFPLELVSPRPANSLLAGDWETEIIEFNPETDQPISTNFETLSLTASGNSLRLTDNDGLFYQGVFENGISLLFRTIIPNPRSARFASFPEADSNSTDDVIGAINFSDINTFSGLLLLQTRAALGSQSQLAFHYRGTRTQPLARGDLNGNSSVDSIDRALLEQQLGLNFEDDDFNLAADLNGDTLIDDQDLDLLDVLLDTLFVDSFE